MRGKQIGNLGVAGYCVGCSAVLCWAGLFCTVFTHSTNILIASGIFVPKWCLNLEIGVLNCVYKRERGSGNEGYDLFAGSKVIL